MGDGGMMARKSRKASTRQPSATVSAPSQTTSTPSRGQSGLASTLSPRRYIFPSVSTPSLAASPPAAPGAIPPQSAFTPLSDAARKRRKKRGLSPDAGPMMSELEKRIFDKTKATRTMMPASFMHVVASMLGQVLAKEQPSLTHQKTENTVPLARTTARAALPIIIKRYAPPRCDISSADQLVNSFSFKIKVADSVRDKQRVREQKKRQRVEQIRNSTSALAELFRTYVPARLRTLTAPLHATGEFWGEFASWIKGESTFLQAFYDDLNVDNKKRRFFADPMMNLNATGKVWDDIYKIRLRMALYDVYQISETAHGEGVSFAMGLKPWEVPHSAIHETVHHFVHPDLDNQLLNIRDDPILRTILEEGLTEYMSRGVRTAVVDALMALPQPPLKPAEADKAKKWGGYNKYFRKIVKLRDILYSHGQDGENALQRVYFHGEGWRLGLLGRGGKTSPVESDRPVPKATDVYFRYAKSKIIDTRPLAPVVNYMQGRSVSTSEVVGHTDKWGSDEYNDRLGMDRAESVKSYLGTKGILPTRVTVDSRGKRDAAKQSNDRKNRRAAVQVIDPMNKYPGTMRKSSSYIGALILWLLSRL